MLSTSLKPVEEVYSTPPSWIPEVFCWTNFVDIWRDYPMWRYICNSLFVAGASTVFNQVLAIPAAYAVSRLRFRGKKMFMYMFLVVQMFSPVIIIMPLFKLMAAWGLLDTYQSLIITNTAFTLSFSIWMLSSYFSSVPVDIENAALIDGCSRVQTISKILVPIAAPGIATTAIYTFISVWNEFMFALTFITRAEMRPLTLGLYNFIRLWTINWHHLMAGALIGIVPVVILFMLALHRYEVRQKLGHALSASAFGGN
jgi:multiple sugar transport system permease protein